MTISGEGTLLAPPERSVKSPICNSLILKGERPASHRGPRREESPSQSPARPRTSKASAVRREELKCLEMVLQRSCRKEDRVSAYLRRAHHLEPAGKERIFCFDGPDEHIRRALLARDDPPWLENQMATSKIFHLKWTVSDCEDDYRYLQEGMLFNHFQRNRELTTKVGLTNNLRRLSCEGPVDVDRFFPRSYDMSSASEVQDFVLDFRRCAALGVLRQHLRLANWAEERRRLMEQLNMDGVDGSCYVCNVNVLRIAVKAMLHWLEDLDGTFFEDEDQRQGGRPHLFTQEWDALVCYSELTDAELCGEDDGEERKRKQRGSYSASGNVIGRGSPLFRSARAENHQRWPEFEQHHWGEPPAILRQHAEETLKLLEARWPQISAQGPMNVWVVKPGSSSKGSGVLCMDSLPEVLHHCKTTSNRIVQKYIERPLLLFSGRKFDLRQWVMVRSFRPLKVYMFSSCYLRLCNEPYDLGDLENRQRHISNWSVNKRGKHVSDGAVASLEEFQQVLEMMTSQRGYWEEELIPQLKTCIVQTLQAVQPNIVQRCESFEVYGFDFLIGEDLKPWLLEVNLSPACESRTAWMSEMLDRMASRLVELLLQGDAFTSDGQAPDWQLICDEGPDAAANPSPATSPVAPSQSEEALDVWGQRALTLTVLGKSVSRRFLRRLDAIWRRNEAQATLAAHWRGWALRRRMRRERWRMAGVVFHRCRQRAWLNLLRLALFQRRRGPAAKLISTVTRCFLCRRELQEVRRRREALRIQSSWRGHLGRRCAAAERRRRAAARLQRWWRSAQLRRRLVAKGHILRWWRQVHLRRAKCAARLQAAAKRRAAQRRYALLSQHVARPTRRLALLMAAVRWRWWRMHCQVSELAVQLQRCFRGFLGRRSAKDRRLLRETFGSWRMQAGPFRRAARLRLQRCWRGCWARRRCARRRQALQMLQSALRRRLCCKQRRWRRAAILVQRRFRGFRCAKRFQHSIRMIMMIQRGFRCWLSRRRLAMLQRFAARRRKWLNQGPEPSPLVETVLKDEETTTQSSTRPESEAPDVSSARSAQSATDDVLDISIGLVEVAEPEVRPGLGGLGPSPPRSPAIGDEPMLAQNLVEAQMPREQRLVGGFGDGEAEAAEAEAELPLLQHLQDMARTFDALMSGVSSTRCLPAPVTPVAPVAAAPAPDLITGSALRAARRLRQQGYAKPTISSSRRTFGHDCSPRHWTGPATTGPSDRDVDHLLRIAYSPSRPTGGTSRGREKTPWRLSNIEPEPWHVTWESR